MEFCQHIEPRNCTFTISWRLPVSSLLHSLFLGVKIISFTQMNLAKLRRVKNALYVQIRVHTVTYISFRFLSPSNAFKGTLLFTIVEWRVTEEERERVWYIG